MRREWKSSVKSKRAVTNLRLYQQNLRKSGRSLFFVVCAVACLVWYVSYLSACRQMKFLELVEIRTWAAVGLTPVNVRHQR